MLTDKDGSVGLDDWVGAQRFKNGRSGGTIPHPFIKPKGWGTRKSKCALAPGGRHFVRWTTLRVKGNYFVAGLARSQARQRYQLATLRQGCHFLARFSISAGLGRSAGVTLSLGLSLPKVRAKPLRTP